MIFGIGRRCFISGEDRHARGFGRLMDEGTKIMGEG
jgi:hypothetical protein